MQDVVLTGALMGLILASAIGPSFFGLITLALTKGKKEGIRFAAGITLSDLIIVVALSFVSAPFIWVLEHPISMLIGGLLLATFGILSFLIKPKKEKEIGVEGNLLLKGFLLNATNPSVYLIWLGFLTICPQKEYLLLYLVIILVVNFLLDIIKTLVFSAFQRHVTASLIKYTKHIIPVTFFITGVILLFKYFVV